MTASLQGAYPLVGGQRALSSYEWEPGSEQLARRLGLDPASILRFDLNTAPSTGDAASAALRRAPGSVPLSEYPPSDYGDLVAAAAAAYGVETSQVTVGAGADEILELIAAAFLGPGRRAVVPVPTYSMYGIVSAQRNATVETVARLGAADGFLLDQAATVAAARGADVLWLCDPNNPTALPEPDGSIDALLDALAAEAMANGVPAPLVVLDEAYAEFMGRIRLTAAPDERPGVIVVRTASKAYGLAGMRVGFGIATRPVIDLLESYRGPAPVSGVSAAVATAALRDPDGLRASVARIGAERERLAVALRGFGFRPRPSVTNFILVPFVSAAAAAETAERLLARGIVLRRYDEGHPLADHLRITVRSQPENDRLLAALEELSR